MGCFISRQQDPTQECTYHGDNRSQTIAKTHDSRFLGIQPKDQIDEEPSSIACKSTPCGLGIQSHWRLDISSSSESGSGVPEHTRYCLIERLGKVRMNISSDDSTNSYYSNEASPKPPVKIVCDKKRIPDVMFLSSRRENQSIDDVGDESVVDWLATDNASVQSTIVSEDDTVNSPSFAFQTQRTMQHTDSNYSIENEGKLHHSVKSTEHVERRHVDLPKNKPIVKSGDWLSHRYVVNDYIILSEIGRGAFAEVRLCKNKTNNKLFAVKIMSRKAFDPKEVDIMKKLRHPNVLQLYEVLDDQRGKVSVVHVHKLSIAQYFLSNCSHEHSKQNLLGNGLSQTR